MQRYPSGPAPHALTTTQTMAMLLTALAAKQQECSTAREDDSGLSPQMRLEEFFWRYFVPKYCCAAQHALSPLTIAEYRSSVKLWTELSGDPPLGRTTVATCRTFVEGLLRRPGKRAGTRIRQRTAQKHCAALQQILDMAAPQTKENKEAATERGLFWLPGEQPRSAPWFPPIVMRNEEGLPKDVLRVEEIRAWLDACRFARQPVLSAAGDAATWWRSLILFAYNSGLRIGTILKLRRSMLRGLDDGTIWLDIPGKIAKQGKTTPQVLSTHAQRALAMLSTADVIYPWPHTLKHLHCVRHVLQTRAGIPIDRQYGFHALRGSNATELFAIDPDAARANLNHEKLATTTRHYVAVDSLVKAQARRTSAALERIPQPRASNGQMLLFD
jgi:integrase